MSTMSNFVSWLKVPLASRVCEPPNPDSESAKGRDLLIDLLRGAAAFAVALFHFNEGHPVLGDWYHRALKLGWLGVSVFFIISGYCIAAAAHRLGSSVTGFWWRRLVRIFPPYWASAVLVLALIAFRTATFGVNDIAPLPRSAKDWLYCFAALNDPASSYAGLNAVYWSLAYEVAFYVAMGVVFLRCGEVWLCLLSLFTLGLDFYPFNQWAQFGLGVGCWYVTRKRSWASYALFAICAWSVASKAIPAVAIVGFATAFAVLWPPRMKWISSLSRIRGLGHISYSLYLVHVPVGCYLVQQGIGGRLRRDTLGASLARDSVLLLASIAVAIVFYRFVESPSHRLARRARVGKE